MILEEPFIYNKRFLFCSEECYNEMRKNMKGDSVSRARKCYLCGAICSGKVCMKCFYKGRRGVVGKRRKDRKDG